MVGDQIMRFPQFLTNSRFLPLLGKTALRPHVYNAFTYFGSCTIYRYTDAQIKEGGLRLLNILWIKEINLANGRPEQDASS